MNPGPPHPHSDLQTLEQALRQAVSRDVNFLQDLKPRAEARVLDLACGSCEEARTLTQLCSQWKQQGNAPPLESVHLTGIDIRAREIAEAVERFRDERIADSATRSRYRFICEDASRLSDHRQLPGEFDLVFLRHQNYWNGAAVWEKIFDQALERLAPNGRLIITSYFDREHVQALEAFSRQGARLVHTLRNPQSRQLHYPGKSVDRHIAILERPGGHP